MKVTIRGSSPVTGDQVKQVIDDLNEQCERFGLKVKNLTCYIRFIDEEGELVEPVNAHGVPIEKTVNFTKTVEVDEKDKGKKKKPAKKRSRKTDLKVMPGGKQD